MNNFIKSLLDKNNFTQKDLANILGISASAVNQWEKPENISPEILFKLSKLFSIKIDNLLQERYNDETLLEKFNRLYGLESYSFSTLKRQKDMELLTAYFWKLNNISERMYDLLYLQMSNNISSEKHEELSYIEKYCQVDISKSPFFEQLRKVEYYGKNKNREISDIIKKNVDIQNKESFIWELKKIYFCGVKDSMEIFEDIIKTGKMELAGDIYFYAYLSLPNIEKDIIATKFNGYGLGVAKIVELFLNCGGHILHERSSFWNKILTISKNDLELIMGNKVLVPQLKEIYALLSQINGNYHYLSKDEYEKIIDYRCENYILNQKYRTKNPIKYWEGIKTSLY